MFQYYRVMLAFLVLVLCLTSCKVESLDQPIIVPLIDQEFQLDLWQSLGSNTSSNLEIQMFTIEEENCLNTLILSTYERTGRALNITLYEILDPEVCDPGLAPARGEQQLTDLTSDIYGIKIELQDVVSNDGTLTVTDDTYTVNMSEETGISWLHKTIHRVPESALWGYVAFTNAEEEARVTTFVEELNELGSQVTLAEGYYGYFTVSNGGNAIKIKDAPDANQAKSLFLKYTAGNDVLDQKVSDFLTTAGNENVEIKLLDSEGNEWTN